MFDLQPRIPPFRISDYIVEKRYKAEICTQQTIWCQANTISRTAVTTSSECAMKTFCRWKECGRQVQKVPLAMLSRGTNGAIRRLDSTAETVSMERHSCRDVESKSYLTPNCGVVVLLGQCRGALPLTLITYAHVCCVFSSIHVLHLGVN